MTILLRILRTTCQNIYRHGLTSLTAVAVITLLFLLLNALLFASFAEKSALKAVNAKLDLALHFTQPIDTFQAQSLATELKKNFTNIRNTQFISSEQAFEQFLVNFGEENAELAEWLNHNTEISPLPATLVLSVEARWHAPILEYLASNKWAELVSLGDPSTGTLASTAATKILVFSNTVNRIGLAAGITFGVLAALIIVAVLRLTLLSRALELTIMRLVGATRAFTRLPFILEGIFFGIAASLSGSGIFFLLLQKLDFSGSGSFYGVLGQLLFDAAKSYSSQFGVLVGWQILAAGLIGYLASFIATRRFVQRELVLG